MTFRELLNLYRSGELSPEQTREVEEAIDREDASGTRCPNWRSAQTLLRAMPILRQKRSFSAS